MMIRIFSWTIGLALLLAGAGALGWVLVERISDALAEPPDRTVDRTVAVEAAEIAIGPIRDVRRFTGTLKPRSRVDVAPRISGRLEAIYVDIGDVVERGQIIARLDDEEFLQEVEQVRAELAVAEATLDERRSALEITQREYERVRQLREQRIASESELDVVRSRYQAEEAAVKVATAELARRQAALRAVEVRLSYTRIRANWEAGGQTRVVGDRYVDEGATVAANTPLATLLDIDTIIAEIFVTERDYLPLRIGMEAELVADSDPDRVHRGRIARMSPAFHEGSRQARIEVELSNPEHALKPGMFVRVRLELERIEDAAIIPRRAVLARDGVQGVFIVNTDDRTARFVPIRLGVREGDRVQVIDPSADELDGPVVVLGQHLLSDGFPVRMTDQNGTTDEHE